MADLRERAIGAVLGLAVGDALGAPFEFRRAGQVPSPLPAFELAWMGLPPGTWTDDTALARNLWLSLIDHGAARAERLGVPEDRIVTTWPLDRVREWTARDR